MGQNLVPNHSFETITSCPNGLSQIYKSPPWFITANSFNNSPDLFNQCDSSSSVISCGVPQNYFGFQQANSGIGYASAKEFKSQGATVIITGRSAEKIAAAAAELGVKG